MKKILYYIICALLIVSCDLEEELTSSYTEDVAWENEKNLDIYMTGFYAAFRDNAEVYSDKFSDGYSDILKYSVSNLDARTDQNKILLQQNIITPSNEMLSAWGNYDRIRRVNEFLHDADLYAGHLDQDFLKIRKAESRFIRAYLYYKMVRNHGGVILRTENSGKSGGLDTNEDANKERSSETDCWNYVISELEAIAPDLSGKINWDDSNYGRVTQGAVYALLTRCALYAKQYDKVIEAGNKLETLGVYALETNYANIFTNNKSKEIILPVMFAKPNYAHFHDKIFRPTGDMTDRGGWACPTEDLVSQYQIKVNGTYENFSWSNPAHAADPYVNREPRFYASILYNGAAWNGRTVETYVGGRDGFTNFQFSSNNAACVTGYFMRKFLQEGNEDYDQKGSDATWIELRYAEVLLNMAEAYANSTTNKNMAKSYEYLNKVRTRGGHLAARTTGSDLDVFMNYIAIERTLELAFEGHRYWDLRRWRKAKEVIDGKRAYGMKITKTGNSYTYDKVPCDDSDRFFPEKYYYIPIPQREINNNTLCKQTTPW